MNDPLSTPLRVLPVNKQTGLKDQLPSVLNQLSNSFSKGKANNNQMPSNRYSIIENQSTYKSTLTNQNSEVQCNYMQPVPVVQTTISLIGHSLKIKMFENVQQFSNFHIKYTILLMNCW